jgi:hypothetical protein
MKKLSLTKQLEQAKQFYNEVSKANYENRAKLIALDNENKELKSDKRWLQQLIQEMSSVNFIKAKNQ